MAASPFLFSGNSWPKGATPSNTQERIELLGQFLKVLGSDKIDCLVADREFIGAEWFALAASQPHPLLHPNPARHEGLADHRSLVAGTQLLPEAFPVRPRVP